MANVGKNIRLLRTRKNMTQDELAERLFVSRQTVSNYETGRSQPDIDTLLRIAEALEVEAQYLLYGSPDTREQLAEKKRAIAACFALTAFAVVYHLLVQLREAFLPRFLMAGSGYSLALILRPALFLLAGWTLMQLVAAVTTLRPLQSKHTKTLFWAVAAALIVYLILVLPASLWALWSDWEIWQLYHAGGEFEYHRAFSVTPWWDAIVMWITRHIKGLSGLFPAAGVVLWLTGGKNCRETASQPSKTNE